MPAEPGERFTVAWQGFSDFERAALSSFFRLAAERSPAYAQVDGIEHADFVVADADQVSSLQAVLAAGRTRDTIFVGASAPPGAMAWLQRPIDPMHIVRELDSLVAHRRHAAGVEDPVVAGAAAPHGPAHSAFGASSFGDLAHAGGPDVLVAEDSAIARRFLQVRLQQLGLRVHLAGSGEEAMAMLEREHFDIVFLDIVLGPPGSLDGLRICQRLKHDPAFAGRAPKVVMVTGLSGAMDRVRGTLAGCDAYLTKPLNEEELFKALCDVDPGFASRESQGVKARRPSPPRR